MRWRRGPRSANLEDRRSQRRGRSPFGRGGGFPLGAGGRMPKLGLGGIVVLLALSFFLKQDLLSLFLGGGQLALPDAGGPVSAPGELATSPGEEEQVDFVSFLLDDLQRTWAEKLPDYRNANLVLFRDAVQSACGMGQTASGPFYCPGDQKVYIDLAFYTELRRRFGAPGDFAQAYVIAHEIGHHIQKLSGVEARVRRAQRARPGDRNSLSVQMELQADCLAGVWGHSAAQRGLLEPGDVEEGLAAAAAIGDDRIQEMSGGRVQPEAWTHGSSRQRVRWFRQGLESGDPERCAFDLG